MSAIVFIDGIHAKPDLYLRLMFTLAKAVLCFLLVYQLISASKKQATGDSTALK
jgi:hypothetical protein